MWSVCLFTKSSVGPVRFTWRVRVLKEVVARDKYSSAKTVLLATVVRSCDSARSGLDLIWVKFLA